MVVGEHRPPAARPRVGGTGGYALGEWATSNASPGRSSSRRAATTESALLCTLTKSSAPLLNLNVSVNRDVLSRINQSGDLILLKSNIKNGAGYRSINRSLAESLALEGRSLNKLQRIIILLWAVVLGTIAMSVVAAGLLLGTRKGAGR